MKKMKRFALALCVLVLVVSTLGTVAYAAAPVNAKIPVTIHLEGTVPAEPETYVVELTPEKASNPMPAGTENGPSNDLFASVVYGFVHEKTLLNTLAAMLCL